ncbi:MAG TPA: M3 family metallopeptidase [Opitutaceae bacterium]
MAGADTARENPFFTESTLPFHYPPFDKITDADYAPAFERGMAEHLREVESIAGNPGKPTFDNTIVALEKSGRLLERVADVFDDMADANTDDAIDSVQTEMAPRRAAHDDDVHMNPRLFERVRELYEERSSLRLDAESLRLLERYYDDFVRAGARLSDADKEKLKRINAEIAGLETTFSQNALKEKNASTVYAGSRSELAGLSEAEIAAAADLAKSDGHDGRFAIPMDNTTGQPKLASLQDRALRERIMQVSLARGSHGGPYDNQATVVRLARLRAEKGVLLGYDNFAAYVVADQTAHTVGAVNDLLAQLVAPAVAKSRSEAAQMQAIIDREHGGFQLASWDWELYSEQVRKERYAFDESQLRPYFELNHVLFDGVFYAANKLYGVTFKEVHDFPVYQPDVRVFEVFDSDGKPLAMLLEDFYARPSKKGGAWMNEFVHQSGLLGELAVVGNHHNIPKPPAGQPTLLTFDEVATLFHEFGHGLHGMFSHVRYPYFAGTRVPTDFVEYPSQVNEMWAAFPDVVRNYAKDYKTGAPMPQELLDKMLAAQKFNQGFATLEYLKATLLDEAWHTLRPEQVPDNVPEFEAATFGKYGASFAPVPPRYRSTYFSHAFSGGYEANYYSYIWADVLVADSIEWFKAHGGLNRASGQHFRNTVLSHGGSVDSMDLFREFTGAGPDVAPLLRRRGLDEAN